VDRSALDRRREQFADRRCAPWRRHAGRGACRLRGLRRDR
jgi:hypothetical protein